jgi:hypothetical protein
MKTFSPGERLFAEDLNDNFAETQTAGNILSGTLAEARVPGLPASRIVSGQFESVLIPGLDAAKVVSGTLAVDRIPNLNASKITAGTVAASLLPAGNVLQVVNSRFDVRQTIATTTFTATAITGSITPQFTGSRILVIAYVNVRGNTGGSQNDVATDTRLLRGGTVIASTREHHRPGTANFATGHHVLAVLDSPSTGSAVTYSVPARVGEVSGRSLDINRDDGSSSLLLVEVR